MEPSREAEENLRLIRALLERAVVYRAISGQAALAGGALAVLAAVLARVSALDATAGGFLGIWLSVLAAAVAFNTFLLWKSAGSKGQPFLSGPMKTALRAILPPLAAGGIAGVAAAIGGGDLRTCASVWVLCYGMALHAAWSFSPASLHRLGLVFLAAGAVLLAFYLNPLGVSWPSGPGSASLVMGATFGLFHVIYGTAVLAAGRRGHD
ncbi:MAG TPA: hypothetical protein VMN36_05345 [Verrucomicrobiales bacterium]|nr:hypothetical protein [Verrucomicrobiales bacterium]